MSFWDLMLKLTLLLEKLVDATTLVIRKWLSFMRKDFLRIFLIYAVVNIVMILIYAWSQQFVQADLDLKPQLTPEAEGSFFPIALMILPFALLLEDLGIRLLPWFFIHDVFRLHTIEVEPATEKGDWHISDKRRWRVWLYHNYIPFYIVVSALWNSWLHQINVFAANDLGIIAYFGIHLVIGSLLAWIFIKKGFWQSYTIHLSWDFFLIGLIILASFL